MSNAIAFSLLGPVTAKLCVLATAGEFSAKAPRNKGLRHRCSGSYSSDVCWSQGRPAADQIGGTFRQHHHHRVYMRRRHMRQRCGIDHAQGFDTADPQIWVEYRVRTASRGAGSKRMVDRNYRISDPVIDLGIGLELCPGHRCMKSQLSTWMAGVSLPRRP